jgi:kynurenine formamidase
LVRIVDLSVPVDASTISPPSQGRRIEISYVHRKPGWWQASWVSLSPHTGTHVDSPLHVIGDAPTIGEIELDNVVGEAVVIDLTDKGANSAITPEDLKKFEEEIRPGDIIVLRTDWTDKKWGTEEYWNDSPYLTLEGAKWLAKKKPKAIAFDFFEEYSARLKDFKPKDFIVHRELLSSGIIIIEHLTNLKKLTRRRVKIFAAPLKLLIAEASPARAFAIED